jgi:putative ABC transport system permease protein
MVVALYNSLNERRREMAILRALGARPWMITAMLLTEATLITGAAILAGLFATYAILMGASGFITSSFGLNLPVAAPGLEEWGRILAMFAIGIVMAAIPAWRAYRNTLVDGLTIRI